MLTVTQVCPYHNFLCSLIFPTVKSISSFHTTLTKHHVLHHDKNVSKKNTVSLNVSVCFRVTHWFSVILLNYDSQSYSGHSSLPQVSQWMQWYMQKKHSNSLYSYCSCLDQGYLSYLSNLIYQIYYVHIWSFPGGSNGKESAHNAWDSSSIHGSGGGGWWRSPGGGDPVFLPGECHGQWKSSQIIWKQMSVAVFQQNFTVPWP